MPAVVSAREALHELLSTDAGMLNLLGEKAPGRARVDWGWISEESEAETFPRFTFHLTAGDLLGRDPVTGDAFEDARVMGNMWAWPGPVGNKQGIAHLEKIDLRLRDLCEDTRHVHQGVSIWYRLGTIADFPAEPGRPIRIARPIIMGIR